MRGGTFPPALLFAALGLALAFAPRSAWISSLFALGASAVAFGVLPFPEEWEEGIFLGCWISVMVTAASVHLVSGLQKGPALILSFNAGAWAGAVASLSGSRVDLLKAVPCVLLLLPAGSLVAQRSSIPIKVLSSWVIAVAVLAATLQLLPVTPGYQPDHME